MPDDGLLAPFQSMGPNTQDESTPVLFGGDALGPKSGHDLLRDWVGRTVADKYRIIRLLGAGGAAEVYEAEHAHLSRRVAIKLLHSRLAIDPDLSHQEVGSPSAPPAAMAGASPLKEEARMLGEVRTRLGRGDLVGAFSVLEALNARFPEGELLQEREALKVGLLYRGGHLEAARERAREFLGRCPTSPHAVELERVAAGR